MILGYRLRELRKENKMSQEDLLALMDKETWLTAEQAVKYGFVDERAVFIDGTHIKASANKRKSAKKEIPAKVKNYQKELENKAASPQPLHKIIMYFELIQSGKKKHNVLYAHVRFRY